MRVFLDVFSRRHYIGGMETQNAIIKQDDIMSGEVLSSVEELQNAVQVAVSEYLARFDLEKPEDITVSAFNGLCLYINATVMATRHNQNTFTGIPQDDNTLAILHTLWNIYFDLCARHNKTLSLIQFCMLSGIHNSLLYKWYNGVFKSATNSQYQSFAKMVLQACESATYGRTVDQNSIGAMFALKSVFGYTETQKTVIEVHNNADLTPQDITAKYAAMVDGESENAKELSDNLAV